MERSDIASRMAAGASWMVLFKLLDRGLGLISVVILARLLVPADFGLIAVAMSLIALLEVLGAFGLETALIQRSEVRREHYDTVWTFNVLFGVASGIVTALLALPTASFYEDPRLAPVMLVLALTRVVQGFANSGVVAFRKELAFDREFRYLITKRLAATLLVTLPLAFILRSYWALVIGSLAAAVIGVWLSFAMHPFRPRASLRGLGELMQFSKWLFVANAMDVAHSRLVDVIVGRTLGAAAVGLLSVGREVARLPGELNAPVQRALFPGYVQLATDREQLRNGFVRVSGVLMLLIVPAGVGLCLLAEPVVKILLGEKWSAAIPVVQILSLNVVLSILLSSAHHVNLAIGMSRSTTMIMLLVLVVTVPLLFALVPPLGVTGAALAMLAGSVVAAPLNLVLLGKAIRFGVADLRRMLARPLAGSALMALAVLFLKAAWPMPDTLSVQLVYALALATTGAVVYAAAVYAFWRSSGGSEGAESWILERLKRLAAAANGRLHIRPN